MDDSVLGGEKELLPEAIVTVENRLSPIWLVPLVAAVVAGWLVWSTLWDRGTTVTITFDSASGIDAGKTRVKLKDVDIGHVASVHLGGGLSNVVVEAILDSSVSDYLRENTRFWVVHPRLTFSGISGLGTLVSGVYLEMEPGSVGRSTQEFQGLSSPPVLRTESAGQEFVVTSQSLGSLSAGSPVSYHGIQVGEVLGYQLEQDQSTINIHLYIKAPYHRLVTRNSRFWNASGVSVAVTPAGVAVKTESVQSLLMGGIAFDTPRPIKDGPPVAAGTLFTLYSDPHGVAEPSATGKIAFVAYFQGSVRGLKPGSLVEYQGIPIGLVSDIRLDSPQEDGVLRVSVLLGLEADKILGENVTEEAALTTIKGWIQRGLRAQLMSSSLLTGELYVALDFHPESPGHLVGSDENYPELPTVPANMEGISQNLANILRKVDQMPLEQIGKELQEAVHGVNQAVNSPDLLDALRGLNRTLRQGEQLMVDLDRQIVPLASGVKTLSQSATLTMEQAGKAMISVDRLLSPEAPMHRQLLETLRELSATAYSLRILSNTLQRNPEALLFGKDKGKKQ